MKVVAGFLVAPIPQAGPSGLCRNDGLGNFPLDVASKLRWGSGAEGDVDYGFELDGRAVARGGAELPAG
jgi:hypothetical protein